MINDRPLLPRYALGDLHQAQLHPRSNLVQMHGAFLAPAIIPPDVVLRKRDDILGVGPLGHRRHLRSGRLVSPAAVHARRAATATVRTQHIISDVLLVPQVEHRAAATTTAANRGGARALQDAAHASGDAVRFDGDAKVAPVDGTAVRVVCNEDDATRRRECEFVWRERGKERLERFHYERQV
jgi:hypothetical protein